MRLRRARCGDDAGGAWLAGDGLAGGLEQRVAARGASISIILRRGGEADPERSAGTGSPTRRALRRI